MSVRFLPLILLGLLVSCEFAQRISHSDAVVMKIGKSVLYESDLAGLIPQGISSEDSAAMAARLIEKWKLEQLLVAKAEAELPAAQLDVSSEMESYRRSLLIYRFESMYVSERLDTVVTDMEVEEYYRENAAFFKKVFIAGAFLAQIFLMEKGIVFVPERREENSVRRKRVKSRIESLRENKR